MSQLITEFWVYYVAALLIGVGVAWYTVRQGWSRRLQDNEDGWRRRLEAAEEKWRATAERGNVDLEAELAQRDARVMALTTDLEVERGKVTAVQDQLEAGRRSLAQQQEEAGLLQAKLATWDERLAEALEMADRYELELKNAQSELSKAVEERLKLERDMLGRSDAYRNESGRLAEEVRQLRARALAIPQLEQKMRELAAENERLSYREGQLRARVHELESRPPPAPDDLKRIKGVGPSLEQLLHSLGITSYRQIATWGGGDLEEIDMHLGEFRGRVERDDWISQARHLYRAKYGQELQ